MKPLWKALTLNIILISAAVSAAELNVRVTDQNGKPVSDVVVYVNSTTAKPTGLVADIVQIDKEFVPYITVIPVGSRVRFPNKDNVRHHVYSFSSAKKFELKLYSGVPTEPVSFDKPGVVALGCNIHDWMIAYVLVVDTPWFARSDSTGLATLQLPQGSQQLHVWHPDIDADVKPMAITVTEPSSNLSLVVAVRPRASPEKQY